MCRLSGPYICYVMLCYGLQFSCGSQQHARGQRSRQPLASPLRVRRSSSVDSAVELACTRLAHKARAALSGLSGLRHGRWCRVRAPSSGRRSGPSELFQPYVTHMYHLLMQRAYRTHCSHLSRQVEIEKTRAPETHPALSLLSQIIVSPQNKLTLRRDFL